MVKRRGEVIEDGLVRDEVSFQVIPGSDETRLIWRLNKMKSVKEINQTAEGSEDFGSIYLLKVNPRFIRRVLLSLQSNSSIGVADRVAIRDLAEPI